MNKNVRNLEVQDKIEYKRWSPTREQVALLEALFAFGIRNPNREQVHEIATRLKVYGEIGEYSVYCWFQNYGYREKQRCLKQSTATTSYSPLALLPPFMNASPFSDRVTLDLFPIPPVLEKKEISPPLQFQVKAPSVELSLRLPSADE
ncbi:WUSCHEL-related homeobox 5-like [Vigna angularis]|uniref:WUSCHEL-related homeobox 5-like n=1 Tax=Phaseolus angularis TaxID=3914 RepID=UPI0022B3B1DC|nr:WUSCHEL-related homeobox 5-like [Vigna angularis]